MLRREGEGHFILCHLWLGDTDCTIWGLGRYSICKVFLTSGGSGGWRNTVSSDVLCCTSVCDTSPYNLAERSGSPDLSFWRQQRRHLQRPSWPPGSLPPARPSTGTGSSCRRMPASTSTSGPSRVRRISPCSTAENNKVQQPQRVSAGGSHPDEWPLCPCRSK